MPDIRYQIVRADVEGCPPLPNQEYDNPAHAAEMARMLSRDRGEKLMVKAIKDDKWKQRERERFDNETYSFLPWFHQEWWISATAYAIHKDHFAHPSVEKAGWIAYTKNAEDGMKDKQTIVRPGTYLNMFDKELERYGVSEARLVRMFMDQYGPLEVKFAATEEEIMSVYDRGPDTCMKGRDWPNDRNPAFVYANGDLQVAYLGTLQKATARTLVWPEKKIFSRVYGDIARLTRGLERLGYKWGAPVGARIKRIALREVKFDPNRGPPCGCFVVPYIDKKNQAGGGHLSVVDKETHLEICEEGRPGSHHCGLPDGYSGLYVPRLDEYPTFTCENCGTPGLPELTTVMDKPEEGEELSWCPKCIKRGAIRCAWSRAFIAKESNDGELNKFVAVDGQFWAEYYAEMYAGLCEMTDRLTVKENLLTIYFADGSKKKVCAQYAGERGAFQSFVSKKHYLGDQRAIIRNHVGNVYVGRPDLKYHAFQCDKCNVHHTLDCRNQHDDKLYCQPCAKNLGVLPPPEAPKAVPRRVTDIFKEAEKRALHLEMKQYQNDPFEAEPRF